MITDAFLPVILISLYYGCYGTSGVAVYWLSIAGLKFTQNWLIVMVPNLRIAPITF